MSTATTSQHHSFPTSLALAAASAAVVLVGGLTAYGISAAQDSTTPAQSTVSTSTTQNRMCPDSRCLPPAQRGGGQNSRSGEQNLKGGHTVPSIP